MSDKHTNDDPDLDLIESGNDKYNDKMFFYAKTYNFCNFDNFNAIINKLMKTDNKYIELAINNFADVKLKMGLYEISNREELIALNGRNNFDMLSSDNYIFVKNYLDKTNNKELKEKFLQLELSDEFKAELSKKEIKKQKKKTI